MTIDAIPIKHGRHTPNLERTPEPAKRGKKHYEFSYRPSPVIERHEIKKTSRTEYGNNWKPSNDLIDFNNKKLLCFIGSQRIKKGIPGKRANQS